MKTYKAVVNSQKEYNVTHKDFESALKINKNLLQDSKYYGICPYCDSPVQLIGLSKEIKNTPHARHTETDVPKVADKTIEAVYCPLNTHKKDANPEDRLSVVTERSLLIKKCLIENYDVISKMINNISDIFFSYEHKTQLFKRAYKGKIWLFPEITQSNIPWILLYTESPMDIKNRLIKQDSKLFQDLKKKGITFMESYITNYSIIDYKDHCKLERTYYSFTNHKRRFDEKNNYIESLHAMLTHSRINDIPPVEGYYTYSDKKIIVDHQELYKKINYYNKNQKRNLKFLEEIKNIIDKIEN